MGNFRRKIFRPKMCLGIANNFEFPDANPLENPSPLKHALWCKNHSRKCVI